VHEWKGGAFHRNAGHVKQATIKGQNHKGFPLAFQEYSPKFPHSKYTLGFAGRPSSNAFYVSTVRTKRYKDDLLLLLLLASHSILA
jgi:hypothetical protein